MGLRRDPQRTSERQNTRNVFLERPWEVKINSSVESNSPCCYFLQRRLVARPIRRDPDPGQNNTPLLTSPLSRKILPSEECNCILMGCWFWSRIASWRRARQWADFKQLLPEEEERGGSEGDAPPRLVPRTWRSTQRPAPSSRFNQNVTLDLSVYKIKCLH